MDRHRLRRRRHQAPGQSRPPLHQGWPVQEGQPLARLRSRARPAAPSSPQDQAEGSGPSPRGGVRADLVGPGDDRDGRSVLLDHRNQRPGRHLALRRDRERGLGPGGRTTIGVEAVEPPRCLRPSGHDLLGQRPRRSGVFDRDRHRVRPRRHRPRRHGRHLGLQHPGGQSAPVAVRRAGQGRWGAGDRDRPGVDPNRGQGRPARCPPGRDRRCARPRVVSIAHPSRCDRHRLRRAPHGRIRPVRCVGRVLDPHPDRRDLWAGGAPRWSGWPRSSATGHRWR